MFRKPSMWCLSPRACLGNAPCSTFSKHDMGYVQLTRQHPDASQHTHSPPLLCGAPSSALLESTPRQKIAARLIKIEKGILNAFREQIEQAQSSAHLPSKLDSTQEIVTWIQ